MRKIYRGIFDNSYGFFITVGISFHHFSYSCGWISLSYFLLLLCWRILFLDWFVLFSICLSLFVLGQSTWPSTLSLKKNYRPDPDRFVPAEMALVLSLYQSKPIGMANLSHSHALFFFFLKLLFRSGKALCQTIGLGTCQYQLGQQLHPYPMLLGAPIPCVIAGFMSELYGTDGTIPFYQFLNP